MTGLSTVSRMTTNTTAIRAAANSRNTRKAIPPMAASCVPLAKAAMSTPTGIPMTTAMASRTPTDSSRFAMTIVPSRDLVACHTSDGDTVRPSAP